MYADLEGKFRSERILALTERFKLNASAALDCIAIGGAYASDDETKFLYGMMEE